MLFTFCPAVNQLCSGHEGNFIYFNIYDGKDFDSLQSFADFTSAGNQKTQENIIISNVLVIKTTHSSCPNTPSYSIAFKHNSYSSENYFYEMHGYADCNNATTMNKLNEIFNKMASSLTLTKMFTGNSPNLSVGQCVTTSISHITTRIFSGKNGEEIPNSGSEVIYSNGIAGVSYDTVQEIENSKEGDSINLCLVSLPQGCPSGDDRGKVYKATNLRTNESWTLPDSQHGCGGA